MWTARDAGVAKLSITSIDTSLAGSNRSGKQRLLPDLAGASDSESAESAASQSRAGTTADPQVVAGGGQPPPQPGQEVVETDQLLVTSEREETMSAASEAAEAAAAAGKAGENDVEIIEPSTTNFDPSRMP